MTKKRKKKASVASPDSRGTTPSPTRRRPGTPEGVSQLLSPRLTSRATSPVSPRTDFSSMSEDETPVQRPSAPAPAVPAPTAPAQPLRTYAAVANTSLPKFRVIPEEGQTPYATIVALEREAPQARVSCRFNLKGEITVTPQDEAAADLLRSRSTFKPLDSSLKETKAFICRFAPQLPLEPLLALPNIVSADRWLVRKDSPTFKVLATFRGPVPESVNLPFWGKFPTAQYVAEPLRCFNCNQFGHHKSKCKRPACCGVCSGPHLTEICQQKFREGGQTTAKCPNCKGPHHAWYKGCKARLDLIARRIQKRPEQSRPRPAVQKPSTPPATEAIPPRVTPPPQRIIPAPPTPPQMAEAATQTEDILSTPSSNSSTQTSSETKEAEANTEISWEYHLEEIPREEGRLPKQQDNYLYSMLYKHADVVENPIIRKHFVRSVYTICLRTIRQLVPLARY